MDIHRRIQKLVHLTVHVYHQINVHVNQTIQEISANYQFVLERIKQTQKCVQEMDFVPHQILVFAMPDSLDPHVMKPSPVLEPLAQIQMYVPHMVIVPLKTNVIVSLDT